MDDERQRDDSDDRPPSAGGVTIDLIGTGERADPIADQIAALREPVERLAAMLTDIGVRGEARVKLVRDDEMTREHLAHKNTPGTTDVLTFDLAEDADDGVLDADILVCVDEARRQAEARGHDAVHELALYIVHGILHCTGHDDTTDAQAEAMHRREDELLRAIGLGVVFAAPARPGVREGAEP